MNLTNHDSTKPDPHRVRLEQPPSCDVCTVQTRRRGEYWECPNCGNRMRADRAARVADIRAQIAAGTYETPAKLSAGVDRLIAAHVPAYRKVRDPMPARMTWSDAHAIYTANKLGWRPPLTFPRLADDVEDVPGQLPLYGGDPNTEVDSDWDGHGGPNRAA